MRILRLFNGRDYGLRIERRRRIISDPRKLFHGPGELSRDHIAWAQGISKSRISRLWREHLRTGEVPVLKPSGRPRRLIEPWEVHTVRQAFEEYRVGACLLEGRIEEDYGVHMGHNRINRIMLELGISREEMRKKSRRKWVRYERPPSMELWHTDWKRLSSLDRWLIAYLDNASRYVVGYGTYEDTSTRAPLEVLEAAIAAYGPPDAVLTQGLGVLRIPLRRWAPSPLQIHETPGGPRCPHGVVQR